MAEMAEARTRDLSRTGDRSDPRSQAFWLLHIGFVVAPTLAGLDKFAHLLTNWDQYLAPWIANLLPFSGHTFMLIVGVIEIVAGLIVAAKPKFGGYLVAAWLAGIIINLVSYPGWFDIALRDLGLLLAALALARLATARERERARVLPSPKLGNQV